MNRIKQLRLEHNLTQTALQMKTGIAQTIFMGGFMKKVLLCSLMLILFTGCAENKQSPAVPSLEAPAHQSSAVPAAGPQQEAEPPDQEQQAEFSGPEKETERPPGILAASEDEVRAQLDELEEGELVSYSPFIETQNIDRLHQWVEAFRTGTPDVVYLLHESVYPSWLSVYKLEYDGGKGYTASRYNNTVGGWVSCRSSVVVRRLSDYVFVSDLPRDIWMEDWQSLVVNHTPVTHRDYQSDEPGESLALLGAMEPEEACAIGMQRALQFYHGCGEGRWRYPGGQYIPPNAPASPVGFLGELSNLESHIMGSVELMGFPCYIVRFTADYTGPSGQVFGYEFIQALDSVSGDRSFIAVTEDFPSPATGWRQSCDRAQEEIRRTPA